MVSLEKCYLSMSVPSDPSTPSTSPRLRTCRSWSQPTGDAAKLQRLQRLQGPFPPAGLQSRKKLYPPSTSHLAGVEEGRERGAEEGGGGGT